MRQNRRGGIRSRKHAAELTLGLSLAAMGAQQAAAQVQDPPASGERADQIVVTGDKVIESPKFTQPLINTPQTIQIIDKRLIQQQGATSLTEALRNSPAVGTFYAGENGNTTTGDSIYMRGFDTSNSIFVDGVRDVGSISRDVFNIEQIEVEKGPAGTDNGRTAPSGAVNLVSKHALPSSFVGGTLSVGVDGQARATADINQPLPGMGGAGLRLNVLWQDSDVPGRDRVNDTRIGIAPSLGLGLNGDTNVFVNLLYVKQDNVPDGYVPTIGLPGWEPEPGLEQLVGNPVDSDNFYGTRADHDDVEATMATLEVKHRFSDTTRLTNITRWGRTDQDYLLTAFMSRAANISFTDPNDLSTYTVLRNINTVKDQRNDILANQTMLRTDFSTGAVAHNIVIGVEFTREEQTNYGHTVTGSRPDASLYNPDWNDVGDLATARNGSGSEGRTDTISAYIFDTAKFFGDKLLISGGIRLDHYETDYFATGVCNNGTGRGAIDCGTAPVGTIVTTTDLSTSGTLFNWKLGAVFKPTEPVSLYANYAVSQQPPGGGNFSLSDSVNSADNPNFDPQKAETFEVGAKWRMFGGRLLGTVALFRTTVSNEINRDVLDGLGNPTQTGEKRVQGIEVSAVGNITDNWSLSAGYSHLDTEVTEGPAVTTDGTPNLTYTPEDSFTLWTTYNLPVGLTFGGGVRHTGGLRRGTDGAVGTPAYTESWTVVDAIVSYAVTDNISLRVNGYNLFDEQYVVSINKSGYRYQPGTPRTFLFSADFRF